MPPSLRLTLLTLVIAMPVVTASGCAGASVAALGRIANRVSQSVLKAGANLFRTSSDDFASKIPPETLRKWRQQLSRQASTATRVSGVYSRAGVSLSKANSSMSKVAERIQDIVTLVKDKYDSLSPSTKYHMKMAKKAFDRYRARQKELAEKASDPDLTEREADALAEDAEGLAAEADRVLERLAALSDIEKLKTRQQYQERYKNYRLRPNRL